MRGNDVCCRGNSGARQVFSRPALRRFMPCTFRGKKGLLLWVKEESRRDRSFCSSSSFFFHSEKFAWLRKKEGDPRSLARLTRISRECSMQNWKRLKGKREALIFPFLHFCAEKIATSFQLFSALPEFLSHLIERRRREKKVACSFTFALHLGRTVKKWLFLNLGHETNFFSVKFFVAFLTRRSSVW